MMSTGLRRYRGRKVNQLAVANAIREAIDSVCLTEIENQCSITPQGNVLGKLINAESGFRRMGEGYRPTYDLWDAVVYSLWYQPCHINMAYGLINWLSSLSRRTHALDAGGKEIEVIDFGAGAWAMQFGVVLAGAEILEWGGTIPKITFHSLDTSAIMLNIGERIWDRFVGYALRDDALTSVVEASRNIASAKIAIDAHTPFESILRINPENEKWLSALHVVYDDTLDDVRTSLASIANLVKPSICLMTANNRKRRELWKCAPFYKNQNPTKFFNERNRDEILSLHHWYKTRGEQYGDLSNFRTLYSYRGTLHSGREWCPSYWTGMIYYSPSGNSLRGRNESAPWILPEIQA